MVAHSPRRVMLGVFSASAAIGALVALLIVGPILTPAERCWQMPFAASGFDEAIAPVGRPRAERRPPVGSVRT